MHPTSPGGKMKANGGDRGDKAGRKGKTIQRILSSKENKKYLVNTLPDNGRVPFPQLYKKWRREQVAANE